MSKESTENGDSLQLLVIARAPTLLGAKAAAKNIKLKFPDVIVGYLQGTLSIVVREPITPELRESLRMICAGTFIEHELRMVK